MGIETVALGASLLGGAISAVGSIQQSQAQSASAKYESEVAANNAAIAQRNASVAAAAGDQQAAQAQMKTRAEVGAMKAAQAAKGMDVNSGSPVDVRSSAAELGELNAITIRSNAAREAYGYQTQSSNFSAQSQLDQSKANNDITSGYMNSGTTFLGSVGNAGMNYANYQLKSGNMVADSSSSFGVNAPSGLGIF